MKKSELLKIIDQELLDKLFGFCYGRTSGSMEAEELCSDIVFALLKVANSEGEIGEIYPFIWRVARNTYADYLEKKNREYGRAYSGDPEDVLLFTEDSHMVEDTVMEDEDAYQLRRIYRQIAFLTKAYREVMIAFYLDGLSVKDIAQIHGVSENTIRQRLFSARNMIKDQMQESEEENMSKMEQKPVGLQRIELALFGNGNPRMGDPRNVCQRQMSKHMVWLCRNTKKTAKEISEELNLPMLYVEEELEIQCRGENWSYGLLKKLPDGRYTNNVLLLDSKELNELQQAYIEVMPEVCDKVVAYMEKNKERYLGFPYLNKKVDLNLVMWQHVTTMAHNVEDCVKSLVNKILEEQRGMEIKSEERPFSIYGYRWSEEIHNNSIGWDGATGNNICGYSYVSIENVYTNKLRAHFHCNDSELLEPRLQLAFRAIKGISVEELSEEEKEQAARAIECGYLYRDGDKLYTKVLVCGKKDRESLFLVDCDIKEECKTQAEQIAKKVAGLIQKYVPEHLIGDFRFANDLAAMPLQGALIEGLVEKGFMTLPEDGIGAEGCWFSVEE